MSKRKDVNLKTFQALSSDPLWRMANAGYWVAFADGRFVSYNENKEALIAYVQAHFPGEQKLVALIEAGAASSPHILDE